ncbi:MAG: DUF2807 domain-containing protein [Bacteroidales bacterium]|nr:DUF2807 domain-containing protein [Bacteroidales bacterium]MBN2757220.1 DUF2807 domain-containing protein [Bacteroidales bacterium]
MKNILFSSILALLVFTSNSCNLFCEKGKGEVEIETRELTEFDEIDIDGQAKVFINQSNTSYVKVEIDSNLLPFIITEISGMKLKIYEKRCLEEITEFKIYIYTPNITKIYVDGSTELRSVGQIKSENIYLKAKGAGNIKLSLDVDELETLAKGSGNIELKGTANKFEINLDGAGSIGAFDLNAKFVDAEVAGAGTCKISVSDKLDGEVSQSGKIYYKGNPKKVSTNVSGSGSIKAK